MVLDNAHSHTNCTVHMVIYRCSQTRQHALDMGTMGLDPNANAVVILFYLCAERVVFSQPKQEEKGINFPCLEERSVFYEGIH
jgi:hypothetical protein